MDDSKQQTLKQLEKEIKTFVLFSPIRKKYFLSKIPHYSKKQLIELQNILTEATASFNMLIQKSLKTKNKNELVSEFTQKINNKRIQALNLKEKIERSKEKDILHDLEKKLNLIENNE